MAYLLTQIILSLALALLIGICIGWLLNGFRAARREHKIREEFIRQSLALNQAETDNKMIEDDYRELKYRSEESIALLKEETRQIPLLQENLEKSQTLVRQMLQKHEAELRQAQAENNQLLSRMNSLENREKAVTKLQMDLNARRINHEHEAATGIRQTSDVSLESPAAPTLSEPSTTAPPESETPENETVVPTPPAEPEARQTEIALEELEQQVESALQQSPDSLSAAISELEAVHRSTDHRNKTLDVESRNVEAMNVDSASLMPETPDSTEPATQEPATQPYDFGSSDRSDNLQEIFGIGPVAERALRKLGITSYEQLARLKREHVEYIADQLEIFPGRIERDDWVGSAKRRLEQEQSDEAMAEPELADA